ncbi:hypothetical protein COCON_G00127030 [Conger conger]|uniref:Tissue factor pathway inhibitor n=1 Tax=Conger conger TaxID=82655 RepID=A0A9Q1DDP1_CONCO|nr:tissue factor pathway inhibitor 2 [Conger conger]KAJ8267531.1 hypothetical protein COCON_G00127030 [Conger conger]
MEYYFFPYYFLFLAHVSGLPPREACLLQVDEGPCRANFQRYYYNTFTQQCEEFSYGGCLGNSNNFMTFQDCQKTCWKIPKVPRICRFGKDEGSCRALFKRYFFNMTSMRCEAFDYGGCKGNNNRFTDPVACMEYCEPHKTTPALCLGPLDKGPCAASIPRYYYNAASKSCEEFLYSGCGGSGNNFITRETCTDVCVKGRKALKHNSSSVKMRIPVKRKLFGAGGLRG